MYWDDGKFWKGCLQTSCEGDTAGMQEWRNHFTLVWFSCMLRSPVAETSERPAATAEIPKQVRAAAYFAAEPSSFHHAFVGRHQMFTWNWVTCQRPSLVLICFKESIALEIQVYCFVWRLHEWTWLNMLLSKGFYHSSIERNISQTGGNWVLLHEEKGGFAFSIHFRLVIVALKSGSKAAHYSQSSRLPTCSLFSMKNVLRWWEVLERLFADQLWRWHSRHARMAEPLHFGLV